MEMDVVFFPLLYSSEYPESQNDGIPSSKTKQNIFMVGNNVHHCQSDQNVSFWDLYMQNFQSGPAVVLLRVLLLWA